MNDPFGRNGRLPWDPPTPDGDVYANPWVRRPHSEAGHSSSGQGHGMAATGSDSTPDGVEMQTLLCRNCHQRQTSPPCTGGGKLIMKKSEKKKTFIQIFKAQFIRYCESTSLRGVPKIVKSRDWKRKLLWSCFVFGFFVGCAMCLIFMVRQFNQHDVIHQKVTKRNRPTPFPSFTVCNTRPISLYGKEIILKKYLTPEVYSQRILKRAYTYRKTWMKKYNVTDKNKFPNRIKNALSNTFQISGFFRTIAKEENLENIGHNLSTTLIECKSVTVENNFVYTRSCDDTGNWTRTLSDLFLNCYTFTANRKNANKIKHIEFYVYLEDQEDVTCLDCSTGLPTQLSGVRVQLHTTGTYQNIYEDGLNLRAGSFTEVRFRTTEWRMMEPPYGVCSKAASNNNNLVLDKNTFSFSEKACINSQIQRRIIKDCGCKEFRLPVPIDMEEISKDMDFCGVIPNDQFNVSGNNKLNTFVDGPSFDKFIDSLNCSMDTFTKMSPDSNDKLSINASSCPTACKYYTYTTTITSTKWPTTSYHATFKSSLSQFRRSSLKRRQAGLKITNSPDFIQNILNKMRMYDEVSSLEKINKTLAWEKQKEVDFIDRNFLSIIVSRANFDIDFVQEKEVFTLTQLLSQSGGLLSIWIGLTFICIVEVIELCLNVFDAYVQRSDT